MDKWEDNSAWFLILPVLIIVFFCVVIPLMAVVNYAIQDISGPGEPVFVGTQWFRQVLLDSRLHSALIRQLCFSVLVLLIEMPLGVAIALVMPRKGWGASLGLVLLALPLIIPWNVIGTIWLLFTRPDTGLFQTGPNPMEMLFNPGAPPLHTWISLIFMEVWHWTPLVALLAHAGLRAIPQVYYQAARIDGASAWATFRYIQLPKIRGGLIIALMLRFMDSLLIYAEPFVLTGGSLDNTPTFLSTYLVKMVVDPATPGPAAAFSLIYLLIILFFSRLFYQVLQNTEKGEFK